MPKKGLAFARHCRLCGERLPLTAFRPKRKACIYCLDDLPKPPNLLIVVPRPRAVRRWWPKDVVAEDPT